MDTSIFLAKVFGIYFLLMGLVVILRRKWFQAVMIELYDNKVSMFIISIITLIMGILLVVAHPAFTPDWCSVISVLAWLTLIKGIVHLALPQRLMPLKRQMLTYNHMFYISGFISLLLGLYLAFQGFYLV